MNRVIYFPEKVKIYLIKKAVDLLVMEGLIHVSCPYSAEKDSYISKMRAKVIAGLLPSDAQKGGLQGKNDVGEDKNTKKGQKTPKIEFTSRLRGNNMEDWQTEVNLGGINMVDTGFIKRFIGEMYNRAIYTIKNPKTGTDYTKKGAFWHGGQQNARTRKRFMEAWNELKPMMKEAYFFTVDIPKEINEGDQIKALGSFSGMCSELERRWRILDGLAVFSALEYGSATGWHKHYILATCEENRHVAEIAQERITQMRLSPYTHRKRWNIEDDPEYLLKTLSQTFEKIYDKVVVKNEEPDIYMKEAFMLWYGCYQLNVRPFNHPKIKSIKEPRVKSEKIAKGEKGAETMHILQNYNKGVECSNREEAKKAFEGTECQRCRLECPIAKWLKSYVYVDNSIQYKELTEVLAEYQ